jgi:hypothetical protein
LFSFDWHFVLSTFSADSKHRSQGIFMPMAGLCIVYIRLGAASASVKRGRVSGAYDRYVRVALTVLEDT